MARYPWFEESQEELVREHAEIKRKYAELTKRQAFADQQRERKAMQVAQSPHMPKVEMEMDFKEAMERIKYFEAQNKPEADRLEKLQAEATQKRAEEAQSPEDRAQAAVKDAVAMLKRGR